MGIFKPLVFAFAAPICLMAQSSGTVKDIDGNVYRTIKIGTQVWMAENLRVTRYNDGTAIPLITDKVLWIGSAASGYCWYDNDSAANASAYGALYNWYAVNSGRLVPHGWHIPTDSEWSVLTKCLGGENVAGGKLKEAGKKCRAFPNTGDANRPGFAARPGGLRDGNGSFDDIGSRGYWWSSSVNDGPYSWGRLLGYNTSSVGRGSFNCSSGFSVRGIKDH